MRAVALTANVMEQDRGVAPARSERLDSSADSISGCGVRPVIEVPCVTVLQQDGGGLARSSLQKMLSAT